jgi:hypothetical protein
LAAVENCVAVTYGTGCWRLRPGDVLTLGRSPSCQVRLPDDDHLSRHAGTLRVLRDCVLVRNDSASKPLVLRPPAGEDRVVEPGAAITSLPYGRFAVVFSGRGGTPVQVDVDASTISHGFAARGAATATAGETVTAPVRFTPGQIRVLAALCSPLLTRTGSRAMPATYAQIAARLGLKPGYVRNVLKTVRESLSGHGIPGLTADDHPSDGQDEHGAGDRFRWELARAALRSGWVGGHDVAALPSDPEEDR